MSQFKPFSIQGRFAIQTDFDTFSYKVAIRFSDDKGKQYQVRFGVPIQAIESVESITEMSFPINGTIEEQG